MKRLTPALTLTKYARPRESRRPGTSDPLARSANRKVLDFLREAGRRVHAREIAKLLRGNHKTTDLARAYCVLEVLSGLGLVRVHDADFYSAAEGDR